MENGKHPRVNIPGGIWRDTTGTRPLRLLYPNYSTLILQAFMGENYLGTWILLFVLRRWENTKGWLDAGPTDHFFFKV